MNPTEIADALEDIAKGAFDATGFAFAFAEATGNAKATVSKLRSGAYNKSKLPGGVLMNRKFYSLTTAPGGVAAGLAMLRSDRKTATHKPAILIVTDGDEVSAEHPASGDTLHCGFTELHHRFGFFLPAAGMSRYEAAEENGVDVKAAGKLARLYDALLKRNPDWKTDAGRHELNRFMTRLIFCMFAEDVGIFPKDQFSRLVFTHAGNDGAETHVAVNHAFTAMKLPVGERQDLPAWADELPYVNGGLFAGDADCPVFDRTAYRYLQDACRLDWQRINPDIFGSMIQSVADPEKRSELGMHYTSVPNILKVLGPLFLDNLDTQIGKARDRINGLAGVLDRIANIRVFDPACGSGNFLVVAYRELRAREMQVLERMNELSGKEVQVQMWSRVNLSSFYGIEITDFGVETAKLSLFIAEYQANSRFAEAFGVKEPALPLRDGGNVVCGNALRIDWEQVCPPPSGDEQVYVAGNPPFLGDGSRSAEQNADMDYVLAGHLNAHRRIDFVSCWIFNAANYIRNRNAQSALVSTNSICQGQSVGALWPNVLKGNIEIGFAHRTFKWRNNASANAAVMCVVVGLRNRSHIPKTIFNEELSVGAVNINAYLLDGAGIYVKATSHSIFGLPHMEYGNKPTDGGYLILSPAEKHELLSARPEATEFVKHFMGSNEVIKGIERYCLWVRNEDAERAAEIPELKERFDKVADFRTKSKAAQTRPAAAYPHRFRQAQNWAKETAILIPRVSSERRPYLPVDHVGAEVIASDSNFALYDAPAWCIALIASRLHLVWIGTVCGKLKSDFRYSNTLGWNTFPVPRFTDQQLDQINASARAILKTRYTHYPETIADLYDPDRMPDDLREVHRRNDELLETMYIGRPFRTDSERLERLFKLYAARIERMERESG